MIARRQPHRFQVKWYWCFRAGARSADRKRQMTKHAHVNELAADLPVRRVHGAVHFIADLTLPYGRVLHD